MTVFLSALKTAYEQSVPVLIETMIRHVRGTVRDVNEDAEYVIVSMPGGFGGELTVMSIPMADSVSISVNGQAELARREATRCLTHPYRHIWSAAYCRLWSGRPAS